MDGPPPPGPPPDVLQLSINFLGPRLVTLFIQGVESGIIVNQSVRFWMDATARARKGKERAIGQDDERWEVKVLVGFVTLIGLFQTCVTASDCWTQFILNFSNFPGAMEVTWGMKIQPIVTVFMAAPVQAFLMWRCWILTKRNWYMLIPLTILWFGSTITAIRVTIDVFQVDFAVLFAIAQSLPVGEFVIPIDPFFMASLVFPAFLDVCLTTILLLFLLRSRSTVLTRRFRRVLANLAVIVWEAALPPCICALLAVITYVTLRSSSQWDLMFQAVLGQLYVISLFVTINGFRHIKSNESGLGPGHGTISTALGRGTWGDSYGGGIPVLRANPPPSTECNDAFSSQSPCVSADYPLHPNPNDSYNDSHCQTKHSGPQFLELQRLDIPKPRDTKDGAARQDANTEDEAGETSTSEIAPVDTDADAMAQMESKSGLTNERGCTSPMMPVEDANANADEKALS